jgi:hypothetical protein
MAENATTEHQVGQGCSWARSLAVKSQIKSHTSIHAALLVSGRAFRKSAWNEGDALDQEIHFEYTLQGGGKAESLSRRPKHDFFFGNEHSFIEAARLVQSVTMQHHAKPLNSNALFPKARYSSFSRLSKRLGSGDGSCRQLFSSSSRYAALLHLLNSARGA